MRLGFAAWIVLLGAYLLVAGPVSRDELIAGVPASAAAAALAVALHRAGERRMRLRGPWMRIIAAPLAALPGDALRVGLVLLRALRHRPEGAVGQVARQPFREAGEGSAGRRGLVELGTSLAPNGIALALPPGKDTLLLHRLAPAPLKRDREWPL